MDFIGLIIGIVIGQLIYWVLLAPHVTKWVTARMERADALAKSKSLTKRQNDMDETWDSLPLKLKNALINNKYEREPHKELEPITWRAWNEQQKLKETK